MRRGEACEKRAQSKAGRACGKRRGVHGKRIGRGERGRLREGTGVPQRKEGGSVLGGSGMREVERWAAKG